MEKVKCIIHYARHDNAVLTIEDITVLRKKGVTSLPKTTQHYYFMKDLMLDVIDILRTNNYYVNVRDETTAKWFDMLFFDITSMYVSPYVFGFVKHTDKGIIYTTPAARSYLTE